MIQPGNSTFRGPCRTWKQLYECAILELNPTILRERIAIARTAILDRAEDVLTGPPNDEHRALNDALRTLRLLEEVAAQENTAA